MQKKIKTLVLLFVALLFVCGVAVYLLGTIRVQQQQAILAVMDQARKATVETLHFKNRNTALIHPGQSGYSVPVYVRRLRQISTVNCPEVFQLAWLNYVQTEERAGAPFAGLGSILEAELAVAHPSPDAMNDALSRMDRLDPRAAWMRLQVAALKYGVQIH